MDYTECKSVVSGNRSVVSAISHSSTGGSTNLSANVGSVGRGKFEGEKVNGLRHGYGVYTSENGSVYRGYWKDDKKQGRFECFYSNGDTYVGIYACFVINFFQCFVCPHHAISHYIYIYIYVYMYMC